MRSVLAGVVAFGIAVSGVAAQSLQGPAAQVEKAVPVDVSDAIEAIRARAGLPAMAVVVTHGRDVVARGVCGVRKLGDETKATFDDQWHLGSCTKSMTATLIAVLVEDGKLRWSSTLGEVFPEIEMDEKWKGVTVEQLLAHRAGVPKDLQRDGMWAALWKATGDTRAARVEFMRTLFKRPPVHEPGTKYEYANGGFMIAGAMAEKVCDKGWEELMREKVFGPLGMKSAGFGIPGAKGKVEQPWGHAPLGPVQSDNPKALGPAGTVHCSMEDWGKYIAVHTGGWREERGAGEWLLKPESIAKLHTAYEAPGQEYGYGWGIAERVWGKGPGGKGTVVTHSGSNTTWFCVVWAAPEKDMAVMVATNKAGDRAAKACDDAASEMIKRYFGAGKK
jgi:CubicO group peptidase (beta-lactamase class C family)